MVDSLSGSDSVKPAVDAVWQISTELLQTMGVASVGYGIVVLLGALLAGPTRGATWVRREWPRGSAIRCGRRPARPC